MANIVGAKPIVLQKAMKRFFVQCPTTYGEAVETARQVFKYAQDDVLSLSCVAEDGEKAQIYPNAWECLVPIMKVVYVDKEEIGEDAETVVPMPKQSPMSECKPCVSEPEPPSSETEEESGVIEEIESATATDEEELPPTSPSPSSIQDPDEQIIIVIQFSDSITREQQYKLRRRTKIFKAFNRFEVDIGCDRKEMVYFFNGKVVGRNQCAQEIGIQHGSIIRAVQVPAVTR